MTIFRFNRILATSFLDIVLLWLADSLYIHAKRYEGMSV